ncbi:hypothetical protein AMATHDRAFT_63442 [Amanita thiersii Skay4041]|uniref:Uncharacterized protein n=1 Tax=Amanita thiersii Skay4041 TaxID=703135 RepID=A0A2A9NNK7_9AGAR|nr:hypothetical protein AMATHDRAFT_63442 [Amanita thiersii Skay4041]
MAKREAGLGLAKENGSQVAEGSVKLASAAEQLKERLSKQKTWRQQHNLATTNGYK